MDHSFAICNKNRNVVLCRRRGNEAIAAADGGNLEVERCVLRMTAFIEERFVRLLAGEDGDEDIVLVMFSEMTAYAALTVMNCLHHNLLVRFL